MTTDPETLAGGGGGDENEAQARLEQEQRAEHQAAGEPTPAPAARPPAALQEPVVHTFLTEPEDTNGVYIVLAASVPCVDGVLHLPESAPLYREVGYYRASSPYYATKAAFEDPATELDEAARDGLGILMRAVPAMHWPGGVEATAYIAPPPPPPELHIGRLRRAREQAEETGGAGAEAAGAGQ